MTRFIDHHPVHSVRPVRLLLMLALAFASLLGLASTPAQAASGGCVTANGTVTCTFNYTGAADTWTVPAGVTQATFDLYGADSAGYYGGGKGGRVLATLAVTPGDTYGIRVGGGNGFNGGGAGGYDGDGSQTGGGASDVRSGTFALTDRLLVAGGGGGSSISALGGAGGYPAGGGGGGAGLYYADGGGGGTQTGGGAGGYGSEYSGGAGILGQGGAGGSAEGGGGGGGYYGGGGGGSGFFTGGGGGGGSSYATSAATNVSYETGVRAGNGQVIITYDQVLYAWSGFFQPIDNLPVVNSVKAGSAIPVKFSLGGDYGLNIFAAGYPKSQQIGCSSSAPVDAIEQTVTAGASSLSYDATTGQYTYVWKTDKAWAGQCRQLIVRLQDGTDHMANFQFK